MKSLTGYTDLFLSPVDGSLSSTLQLPVLDPGVLWLGAIDHETQQPITSNFDLNKLCDLTDPLNVLPCLLKLSIANLPYLLEGEKPYVEFARAIPGLDYLTVADEEEILAALAIDIIGAVIGKSKNDPNKPPKHTIEVDVKFKGMPENLYLGKDVGDFKNNFSYSNIGIGFDLFTQGHWDSSDEPAALSLLENIAIGFGAMRNVGSVVTFGSHVGSPLRNIAIGKNSLYYAMGDDNIAIGNNVLFWNTIYSSSIALGKNALQNLGAGIDVSALINAKTNIIAIGENSLGSLRRTGGDLIAIGSGAMGNVGNDNVILPNAFNGFINGSIAIGTEALQGFSGESRSVTPDGSIAIGYKSLWCYSPFFASSFTALDNIGAKPNIGIGYESLYWARSGGSNLAIGMRALRFLNIDNATAGLTAENRHIAIGDMAMQYFSSSRAVKHQRPNLAIGVEALGKNESSTTETVFRGCMAIGDQALYTCTQGEFCMGIGLYADVEKKDLVNAIAIGPYSKVASSHSMVLGGYDTSVIGTDIYYPNIGIGTNDPLYALHVGGTREDSIASIFLADTSPAPSLSDNKGSLLYSIASSCWLTDSLRPNGDLIITRTNPFFHGSISLAQDFLSGKVTFTEENDHCYLTTKLYGKVDLGAPITLTGDILGTGDASNNVNTKFAPNPTFEGEATFNGSSEFVGQSTFDDLAIFNGAAIQLPCDSAMPSNPLKGMIRFSQVQ